MREGHFKNLKSLRRYAARVIYSLFFLSTPSLTVAAIPFDSPADKTLYSLAEQNDPEAQYLIGRKYYSGNAVKKDIHEAIKWFELAATQKHTRAQFQLGIIYLRGESGIKPNHVYALSYLQEAANNQYAEAQFELANLQFRGELENVNYTEAIKWYRAAAEQQHVRSMVALGKILNEGRGGINPQPKEAKHLLSLAAESGNAEAIDYLREMVRNTSAKYRNEASITAFQAKLNNASTGHIPSQYEVGMAYLNGNGVDSDKSLAAKWLRRAAMNDHPEAQYQLSQLYRDGIGTEKNHRRAVEWLKIAATAGVREAQNELRSMYQSSSSMDGFYEFVDVFDDENKLETANANVTTRTVEPVVTNISKSPSETKPQKTAIVIKDAPIKNHTAANPTSSSVTPIVDDFYTLELDPTDAEKQYQLANRYLTGNNLFQDSRRAAYWFEQAAVQDHTEAQFQLGEMYKHGNGVTASVAKAKFWLDKAANAGSTDAKNSLRDLSGIQINTPRNMVKTNLPEDNSLEKQHDLNSKNTHSKSEEPVSENPITNLPESPQNQANVQANAGMIGAMGKIESATNNVDKEIQSLIEAANNNELQAQVKLADMYRKGRGVDRDLIIAAQWYQKAATEGHAEAQFRLGDMYKQGTGVEKNNALAIKWYRKAANQGHKAAKHRLGGCRIC